MLGDRKKTVIDVEGSKVGKHVDAVLRTESGRALWVELFHKCGYNLSSLRVSRVTGDIAPLSTECAETLRALYIDLRRLASPELLAVAERMAETPVVAQPQEERKK
jgi:hypothetical protein